MSKSLFLITDNSYCKTFVKIMSFKGSNVAWTVFGSNAASTVKKIDWNQIVWRKRHDMKPTSDPR